MSILRRSTTGCTFCKLKRKKCDETKPQCLRCMASGRACSYEYVEHSKLDGHRVKRTKPAPRPHRASEITPASETQNSSAFPLEVDGTPSLSYPSSSKSSAVLAHSLPSEWSYEPDPIVPPSAIDSLALTPVSPVSSQLGPLVDFGVSTSPDQFPLGILPAYNGAPIAYPSISQSSVRPHLEDTEDDDEDPESVRIYLCKTPVIDKNVKDNTLPFVLHCYFQWAIGSVFEPLEVVHTMRDQVVSGFSSVNTRSKTILIANVMEMFAKSFIIDDTRKSILNHLALDVQRSGSYVICIPPSVDALDRQHATRALDSILEIHTLQLYGQSPSDSFQLLDYVAPVFRRACFEPPGQPVNLPNILMDPNVNVRHFATIDIILSVISGQPTHFEYEAPFSLELCEQIYCWQLQGNYGLQWLYGLPDQFLILFAWINKLSETPGAGNNLQLIAWIERLLPQIKLVIGQSSDPALRIRRMAVQECWRFAVLVYLYMVLCNVNALDSRVIRAQKGYMRLVRGVKPGRNPDFYLTVSMAIVGVATTEERDRDTLRQRILNMAQFAERGTCGNYIMLRLEDIWARTRDEGRPAVWADLGIANFILTGR